MKRTLLAGSFYALAGLATLLLAASIFYSCRTGGDPHHSGSAAVHEGPPAEAIHATEAPPAVDGERIVVAHPLSASDNLSARDEW